MTHFAKPSLDLLTWVLNARLLPVYRNVINKINHPTGRPRDARSWRKAFKAQWKKCAATDVSGRDIFPYTKYDPNPYDWVCGCPAFRSSRFLICKHLIDLCHPVSSRFFLEVTRNRTTPFWSHPSLQPLIPCDVSPTQLTQSAINELTDALADTNIDIDDDSDSDLDFDDSLPEERAKGFEERINKTANILEKFAKLYRYQIQFGELRFEREAEKQLARAVGFMEDCLDVERLENSLTGEKPTTWGRKSTTMFLFTRPPPNCT